MRRFLYRNRWATVLVAGLLMFATSGMMLSRMTCLVSGHSIMSFGLIEECCPATDDKGMASISAVCCEIGQTAKWEAGFVGNSVVDLVEVLLSLEAAPIEMILLSEQLQPVWLESRPPPHDPGERLARLGTFLI